jgi:beta-1,4-N-acetylglucosaminyltransferase
VISHAGAGTCIDVLSRKKNLIVVINHSLMNNHQIELAEQLHKEKYLFYSTISQLPETLQSFDVTQLREYEKGNVKKFVEYLDDFMGFVN